MINIRRAEDRGHANHGWLDSYHTFSFAGYFDPQQMGYGKLRVINDDTVDPGKGFDTHGHRDMEIISYVLQGALEHRDSMGNGSLIKPGDVQRMSAGTGVTHSEFNASRSEPVHFLQIWILPEHEGTEPGYEQKHFPATEREGNLRLVGSRDGRDGSITINQDLDLYAALLSMEQQLSYEFTANRSGWIQIASGSVLLNGNERLSAGDGVACSDGEIVTVTGLGAAELLLFDMG